MPEQQLTELVYRVESDIKTALLKKHMTQVELADLIGENRQQVNRAIKGDVSPKAREIRSKIAKVLDL
ncbi:MULTISPECIES: helix-turn-helix domain-containing protein [Companilactobacillus]|uniref:HTH cro/C1-type domain-containing protein n=1 Tax=Companilactobacillus nantensis DSM 16982 TaxID=1423774 RepID=A0A0R1WHM4_9LACO|nr:helix-turn-helix transcriptional regulator [Companilactobacillus nantensis]KRM17458.1 hypothetical protein FD31_GL002648 [Companilactobacillus nantensis DSM 16982]GEO64429.1 hypothetical protein LNA01_16120 [Companilactobacillus nantensis]